MRGLSIIVIFLFLGFNFGKTLAQPTLRLPFNKKISTKDGLSSYNVKEIIQDKYGFIWISTQDGLNRYDGKSFIVYNKSLEGSYQLLGNDVWDIEEDVSRNMLWVITAYGGINGINLQTAKVCFSLPAIAEQAFPNDWLRCLRLVENNIWIGTDDGLTIYNLEKKKFESFERIPFLKNRDANFSVDEIFIDHNKNVWLFIANYGLVIYSGHTRKLLSFYSLPQLQLKNKQLIKQFTSIVPLSREKLLIGTDQGFRRITFTQNGATTISSGLFDGDGNFASRNIQTANIDSLQNIWFATSSKLFKVDSHGQKIQEVNDSNTDAGIDWLNYVEAIFFDRQNNLWVGARKGVAYTKSSGSAFTPYFVSDDLSMKIDHAFYLYPYSDSIVYVCSETGLFKADILKNKFTAIDRSKLYYFITEHVDKNLLTSNEQGFFVYRPDKKISEVSQYYPELATLKNASINSMVYVDDSMAVIGTETMEGSYVWNFKKKSLKKIVSEYEGKEPPTNIVNGLYKDRNNSIWILGDKMISIYNPYNLKTKNTKPSSLINDVPYTLFFDVCEAKNYYWLAAYGSGIIQLDSNFKVQKTYSVKDGLTNSGVYKLFPFNDSLIFITSNNGLSVFNIEKKSFSNYYQNDGLNSNAFEEGCGLYKNGKIFVGGVNGFTIINPERFSSNITPPTLYLNSIKMETKSGSIDTTDLFLKNLKIPNNVLQTTVSFSALNYSNPSRTTFEYKIEELHNEWINLGAQNFLNLMGLGPKKYTLLVRSANEDNVWTEQPLAITLKFLPKWYQTLLFKILVSLAILLAVLGLFYSFYRRRINEIQKAAKIRKEIADDLHDDLGGSLSAVGIYAQRALIEDDKESLLVQIAESVIYTLAGLKDLIWVLNDSGDTINDFMERIRKFAFPVANAKGIELECFVDDELRDKNLSKAEKKSLLMLTKETINNGLKYAECKKIRVSVKQQDGRLTLTIEDDGKGFDVSKSYDSHGLKNILKRAKEIHFTAEIKSVEGRGTTVKVVKG